MKLDERDSIIIDTLLSLGMNKKIAENPDAVKETLKIANKALKDIDVMNKDSQVQVEDALKGIIDEDHSIFYTENSQKDSYLPGKDWKQTFNVRVTQSKKININVDDKSRTVINEKEDSIYGYANRNNNHPEFNPSLENHNELKVYPMGDVKGQEYTTEKTIVIENGIETEYVESNRTKDFVDVNSMKVHNNGSIKPNLEKGQYIATENFSASENKKYQNVGLGMERLAIYVDNGSKFQFIRNEDMTTARAMVSQNEVEFNGAQNYAYRDARGLKSPVPGIRYMPEVLIVSENFTGQFLNALVAVYGKEYTDIYSAWDTAKTNEGNEKFEKLQNKVNDFRKNIVLQQDILSENPKLAELSEIWKGNKEPEKVEAADLTAYKQTSIEEVNEEKNKEELRENEPDVSSTNNTVDSIFEKSYEMVKKEPNIFKRLISFIKEKFRGKDQNQNKENNKNNDNLQL